MNFFCIFFASGTPNVPLPRYLCTRFRVQISESTVYDQKIFHWCSPRRTVKDARANAEQLLADVRKAKREALRFKKEFETLVRYCVVTERELQELLTEFDRKSTDPPSSKP